MTETNALSIGHSHQHFPAFDGQWRQAAWALVARGARMVEYWHWHSIHYGHEQYWLGVLNHDGEPGRCYDEVKRIASDFARAGDTVVGLEPHADVALLYSRESRWAMEFQPPLATDDGAPDRGSYERIFTAFYAGLFGAGVQAEILYAQDFESTDHPVLIVPALYVADDALLDRLVAYAAGGGHLVLSFRGGYADEEARPRTVTQPARLTEAVGATYGEYTNLTAPVRVSGDFGGAATAWADALQPTTAEALAHYEHPHLGRWPAITTHEHGKGRVTYVGTLPDRELAVALGALAASGSGPLGGPTENGYGHERARSGGGTRAFCVELVVGAGATGDAGGGDRCAVRIRSRFRRDPGSGSMGRPGALGEAPGEGRRGGETS